MQLEKNQKLCFTFFTLFLIHKSFYRNYLDHRKLKTEANKDLPRGAKGRLLLVSLSNYQCN